jgi:hypothetical protein
MQTAWGNYKVAPTDFIEHMMAIYKQFMLSFATIYEQDELGGDNWTADILKGRAKRMAAGGTLRVEDSTREEHAEKKVVNPSPDETPHRYENWHRRTHAPHRLALAAAPKAMQRGLSVHTRSGARRSYGSASNYE